jgi:hypothetical protein
MENDYVVIIIYFLLRSRFKKQLIKIKNCLIDIVLCANIFAVGDGFKTQGS